MKSILPLSPYCRTARIGSLLHRLQAAAVSTDNPQFYIDQLMTFIVNPPPDVRDRWKRGAQLCCGWGIPTTGASVYRMYRRHALEWHLRALPTAATIPALPTLEPVRR